MKPVLSIFLKEPQNAVTVVLRNNAYCTFICTNILSYVSKKVKYNALFLIKQTTQKTGPGFVFLLLYLQTLFLTVFYCNTHQYFTGKHRNQFATKATKN